MNHVAPLRRKPMHHKRDVFHAYMVDGARFAGELDMPVVRGELLVPDRLVPFSEAMTRSCMDYRAHVHFFEDDSAFEKFWKSPARYMRKLSKFRGIIGPDFSTCRDFPVALKHWNGYRNQACTYYLDRCCDHVIPNVRCEVDDADTVLAGIPRGSLVAVGARSCVHRVDDRRAFVAALRAAVDILEPLGIVWYGSTAYGVTDYPRSLGIPVHVFPGLPCKGGCTLAGGANG